MTSLSPLLLPPLSPEAINCLMRAIEIYTDMVRATASLSEFPQPVCVCGAPRDPGQLSGSGLQPPTSHRLPSLSFTEVIVIEASSGQGGDPHLTMCEASGSSPSSTWEYHGNRESSIYGVVLWYLSPFHLGNGSQAKKAHTSPQTRSCVQPHGSTCTGEAPQMVERCCGVSPSLVSILKK